ncbi:MAG: Smr/MutS family endonuclease [Desulfovibrio sp.]|nr:Smr/MutS family endonuclease [Desulfovibrio sp.]
MAKSSSHDNPFAKLDRGRFPKRRGPEKPVHEPRIAAPARDSAQPPLDEGSLFDRAMQDVAPLAGKARNAPELTAPAPPPPPPDPDEETRRVLKALVTGEAEFTLEHLDEYLLGYIAQLDRRILQRLRNGEYSPEAHLDLHGLNTLQAFDALVAFIRHHYMHGKRCVLVVTGRGKNSPEGQGIIKDRVQGWLTRDPFKRVVLAFCTALPKHGGAGAIYVLLRKFNKTKGKIVWERTIWDEDV